MSKPLVFFGSGPLGLATLEAVADKLNIQVIITKPAPSHGHKTTPPVIKFAQDSGLRLHTPSNKQELSELFSSGELPSTCGLVVDYGLIIPQDVIDYFELGIINSHFSLLPDWRGADPITFPLLEGDKTTGVTLMQIVAALDEGDMLAQSEIDIEPTETNITLTNKLIELSNHMLIEVMPEYIAGTVQPMPQPDNASYSRKLFKKDGEIDWQKPAEQIEREIRAFQGWPKSYTKFAEKEVIITAASLSNEQGNPGDTFIKEGQLGVYTSKDALIIEKLKVAGKSEMKSSAFLAGYKDRI